VRGAGAWHGLLDHGDARACAQQLQRAGQTDHARTQNQYIVFATHAHIVRAPVCTLRMVARRVSSGRQAAAQGRMRVAM